MNSYDDIEARGFALNDMWYGPCQLLGAMVADDCIADMWERDEFSHLRDLDEVEDAQRRVFKTTSARAVAQGHQNVWHLCIQHINPKGPTTS